jgi:hypothetical protein
MSERPSQTVRLKQFEAQFTAWAQQRGLTAYSKHFPDEMLVVDLPDSAGGRHSLGISLPASKTCVFVYVFDNPPGGRKDADHKLDRPFICQPDTIEEALNQGYAWIEKWAADHGRQLIPTPVAD